MFHKALAVLLVLSWVTLAGVDVLEDLNFADQIQVNGPAKASSHGAGQFGSLANNIVESASHSRVPHSLALEQLIEQSSLTSHTAVSKTSKLHKLHRVFLI